MLQSRQSSVGKVLKLLLERGTDVHAVNGEGQAPYELSLAYGNGKIACLEDSEKGSLSPFLAFMRSLISF